MAGLESRDRVTNPRQSKIHIVKPGNGLPNYSYYTLYEDLLNAIKQDHPVVIGVYGTLANLPTVNVNLGTVALVRDEKRLYVYDTTGWEPGSNGASQTLTPENTVVYDPDEVYESGNVFISYVNEASADPFFHDAAIYRSRVAGVAGVSPEDDLYDKDTNPDGKWEYQGQTVTLQSGGLASVAQPHAIEIRGITDYAEGNNMFDLSTLFLYEFDPSISSADDGDNFIKPNDIDSADPGRWKKVKEFGTGDGSAKSRSYTIDFLTTSIIAQDINMFEAATIDNIIASNIASILLTYSGGLQQAITPGENAIAITAGDILTWEITRTNAGEPAALGIHLTIND